MLDYLRPGDHFLDIGANIGLYTLLAYSIVGPTGNIDAFEPNKEIASRLQKTLNLNQITNTTVHEVAVADFSGKVSFDLSGDDCTSHVTNPIEVNSENTVNSVRLENYLTNVPFAMAKLDIEGYEPIALRGATSWLKVGNPPVLQIEMAGYSNRYGISTSKFIDQLRELGYFTAIYIPETRTISYTDRPWEIPVDNVLAVCRDREDFVLERFSQ